MATHSLSLSTTGTVVLAAQGVAAPFVNLTGTLTGNVTLDFGNVAGYWLVSTAALALGGHVLTFGSGSGTVTPIAVGQVYSVLTFGGNTISASSAVGASVTLTAGAGISVGSGPAYTVTNTGVTSAVAGTGISLSGGTGAVTITNTVALPTLTNHDIVLGAGTTTPAFLAPGASGNVPVSNGTDFVSQALAYSQITGTPTIPTLPTLTNHAIVTGQGTTTPLFLAPGVAGNLITSNGTDWVVIASPLSTSQGGTNVTSAASAGNVLTSNGTNWVSQAPAGNVTAVASSGGPSAPATVAPSATVTIATVTLTAVAGHLAIWEGFPELSTTGVSLGGQMALTVNLDGSSVASWQQVLATGGVVSAVAGGAVFLWQAVSAGSHTVNITAACGATQSGGASGSILVASVAL
jgi:hypothetical protein